VSSVGGATWRLGPVGGAPRRTTPSPSSERRGIGRSTRRAFLTDAVAASAALLLAGGPRAAEPGPTRYLLLNRTPGHPWWYNNPESFTPDGFEEVRRAVTSRPDGPIRVGVSYIFSYLNAADPAKCEASLRRFLELAQAAETPVMVHLDGENWWDARPELWNWWDPKRPGYNPANAANVEWTGWGPEHALKIAWRNWGRQIRVLPPPNLISPAYRAACRQAMSRLVPIVRDWWQALPLDRRDLFVGLKLGHETSIGVNAWHYPGGNALLDQPAERDPQYGLRTDDVIARGVAGQGYAAVSSAGLRTTGDLTEDDLLEVCRRHLADLCRQAAALGLPRDRIFTHGVGWREGEKLYQAALNADACPGWSFYRHAGDPLADRAVAECLKRSDAPWWGAVEWLYQGPRTVQDWRRALTKTLGTERCRLLCVFNWEGVRDSGAILEAMRQVAAGAGLG
jgi:hypothetical protein